MSAPFGSWWSVSAPCRNTALHLASRSGHTESVKALLEKGAAVNAKNRHGETAFHVAKDGRAYVAAVEVRCVCHCRAKACHAAGSATRISHVILQARMSKRDMLEIDDTADVRPAKKSDLSGRRNDSEGKVSRAAPLSHAAQPQ